MRFKEYTKTLKRNGNDIISYGTRVATIIGDELHVHGNYSAPTSRHISYAANELNLTKVKSNEYHPQAWHKSYNFFTKRLRHNSEK